MDLEEWELIPDEGFLEIHDDGGKKIYSRKYPSELRSVLQMNYFICPPNMANQQILPVSFDLKQDRETSTKIPVREIKIMTPQASETITKALDGTSDQDPVSQVFFKKMKDADHQFVDMKVESPISNSGRGIISQIEGSGAFQFEEKVMGPLKEAKADTETVIDLNEDKKDHDMELKSAADDDDEGGLMNIWKRSLTGIGAICSFGFAAATVCIIVFSSNRKGKHLQKNQNLTVQIYTNDKRIKQVAHHANKLNEAITGLRGIPITRAHITVGGYYDADAAL